MEIRKGGTSSKKARVGPAAPPAVNLSPLPRARAGFWKMKKGTSGPSLAPRAIRDLVSNPAWRRSFRAMRTVAALPLPPPSPAATGILFRIRISKSSVDPELLAKEPGSPAGQVVRPFGDGLPFGDQPDPFAARAGFRSGHRGRPGASGSESRGIRPAAFSNTSR